MTTDILPLYGHVRASGNHKQVFQVLALLQQRVSTLHYNSEELFTSGQQMDFLEGNQTNAAENTHCFAVLYRFLVFLSSDTTAVQDRRNGNSFSQLS